MLKFLILASIVLVVVQLVRVANAGRLLRLYPQNLLFGPLLLQKKLAVADYFVSLIVAIILVEVLVNTSQDADAYSRLKAFHLVFVCTFVTSFLLMIWPFNGLRSSKWHKRFRIIHLSSLGVLALSGVPMLYLVTAPSMGDLLQMAFRF